MHVKVLYFKKKNLLNIPAAALQAPLFSVLQPNTVNYGKIGYKIAHQMAHGFDTTGIKYNKDGKIYDLPEDIRKSIAEKTECFANQYNQFKTSEIEDDINEIETKLINENLSDSLGINLVFSALKEIETVNKSLQLPGLKHWSNKKIFFLSFARLHCFNATEKHKELLQNYYRRSSRNYRVNIPLQNFEEFAEAFNCPIDTPMNPSSKCKLW
ncbi:neprilysin-21-like [Leptopilina heterotoma]|uniref:neprilysin-21-like n=1 Tax=Leptopilina heterotoma TaxID=63436 RepID=UPI001CAA3295|nr:neprilysin-21-like [Leptopilina heterotoma]